jgi:hypothetical protein
MDARGIIRFFVKAVLLLPATLLLWGSTPVARHYHIALANCARHTYAGPHSDGVIRDVRVIDGDFVVRVIANGARKTLVVTAADVTDNACVLIALYLASPFFSLASLMAYLVAAIVALFGVHVASLYIIVRVAIAWRENSTTSSAGLVESIGPWLYPLALLLWAPYLVAYLRGRPGRLNRTGSRSP